MNSKLIFLLVALTGQSVLCRPDSYESVENVGLAGAFSGSSEEGSVETALSSDEYSSDETPLFGYDPAKDGEPDAYIERENAQWVSPAFRANMKDMYKKYLGEPLPEPTPDQLTKIDMKLNKAEINRQNELRAMHGAPPLVYDEKLAAYAQNYAEKISNKMAQGYGFEHNPEKDKYRIGENMAGDGPTQGTYDAKKGGFTWGEDTWKPSYDGHAANMWYAEIDNYKQNGNRPSQSHDPKKATGHFTQVVWKKSQKVGCGMACYKQNDMGGARPGKACNVICNYYPAGNTQGQQNFDENVNV